MNRRSFLFLSALSPLFANEYIATHNDIYLPLQDMQTLYKLNHRLKSLRRFVGYANFNIISFDEALYYGRNYPKVGTFSNQELALIEKLFHIDPSTLGFFGKKTVENITTVIKKSDLEKIPYSGHFIFKGKPLDDYNRIIQDVGDNVILTSGVRNVIKQLSLYIGKLKELNGNLTKASKIIAPPAYTYHAISDFDVGKKGWGEKNFTAEFARTKEFAKMQKLNYVSIRYTINNKDGVRFEPWHVKVI
jgi:zinc D-Ala-D-Ala carboxypeptidase